MGLITDEVWLLLLLGGVLIAALAPLLFRLAKRWTSLIIALYPLAVSGYLASQLPVVLNDHHAIESVVEWVPSLGINLSFYLDGLSLLMGLLISGIGTVIVIYAQGYLDNDENLGTFYTYLLIFMVAMLGLVWSGNLITLFIFWEITSISSYLLIGYKNNYESSRNAALQALLITGSGGLVLLAGLVLVGIMGGSFELAELLSGHQPLGNHPLYMMALPLVLIGAFTKSAQVPFHTWLPGAMAAPTPVSAYLHSATMVKAGIYLLARLSPLLAGTNAWFYGVSLVGAATMLMGAYLSWQNTDLKKILAYSTISVLGTLVMLLGMGADNHYAIEAMVVFLLAHALYKGCLFMVAGAIDHATGTREIDQLAGLRKVMPALFIAATIAALSKAGIPFFLGFIGKELLYEATLHSSALIVFLTGAAVISNAMVGASAGLVIIKPFLGAEVKSPHHPHKPSFALQLGAIVLSVLTLLFGLMPSLLDGLTSVAATNIFFEEKELHAHLAIWHGIPDPLFPSALLLSVLTVALAILIYQARPALLRPLLPLRGDSWGAQNWYQGTLDGMRAMASWSTSLLQNGDLRYYLITIVSGFLLLTGGTLLIGGFTLPIQPDFESLGFLEFVVCILIVVSASFATRFESRLAGIAALGGVGFGMALLFMLLGAPDLAMTQISIETLAVVMIALIMGRLPYYLADMTVLDRTGTVFISGGIGVLVTLLVLFVTSNSADSLLSPYFAQNSYELAHGRNVVNVILVDFRGFDTLGEITVLAVAGVGVYALSHFRRMQRRRSAEMEQTN